MSIFIQIASYRDPELLPTIRDCIYKANNPSRLSFGICWQHATEDVWDCLDEYKNDSRFRIMDVKWNESKGLGWARSHTQKLWNGEDYTLQIDSHHRFIQNWDEELITMIKQTNSNKPIITTYAIPYTPGEALQYNTPYKMVGKKFSPYGTILFYPQPIEHIEQYTKPIPARFVSGHFYFTLGIHCKEYKYDPDIYFAGDEISLSIRSYTLGYDIYHPHKIIMWHEYTRSGRKKHWDDFNSTTKQNGTVKDLWHELDDYSKRKLRHLLQEENNNIDLGEYGLGNVRSHSDYEKYAGICFKERKLHPDTITGFNPPVNKSYEDWERYQLYNYELQLPLYEKKFTYIYISIEDINNKVLYYREIHDYVPILSVSFETNLIPHHWVFLPFNETGWDERIITTFHEQFSDNVFTTIATQIKNKRSSIVINDNSVYQIKPPKLFTNLFK